MGIVEEIESELNGARFRRADLHVHSYGSGGSYDVKDITLTPAKIIEVALQQGIEILSITDHNSIGNVEVAVELGVKAGILVIPGVELSTPQGHLLLYFPDYYALSRCVGKLNISRDKTQCSETIPQCLDYAREFGGLGIAAHIESEAGFEQVIQGYPPAKESILTSDTLLGLEISKIESEALYTSRDEDQNRANLLKRRKLAIGRGDDHEYEIAKLLSSDAHSVNKLFHNASGGKKLTRLKVDTLSFEAVKTALLDPAARVRLEDKIPDARPVIVGMKLEGGFLHEQIIHFSRNLTCIIGGRGAGKSTLLESIRCASGLGAKDSLLDSDVWSDKISLVYENEAGEREILVRERYGDVRNETHEDGLCQLQLEIFGQGTTAEALQRSDQDSSALLFFLDGFLDLKLLKQREKQLLLELKDNSTRVKQLTREVSTLAVAKQAKANAERKLVAIKKTKAEEVVKLESALSIEKALRDQIIGSLERSLKGLNTSLDQLNITEALQDYDEASIVVGKAEFKQVKKTLVALGSTIESSCKKIKEEIKGTITQLNSHLAIWKEKEASHRQQIEKIKKELEAQGVILDIATIKKIVQEVTLAKTRLSDLLKQKVQLDSALQERRKLVDQRMGIRREIFQKRQALGIKLTEGLRSTISDFEVSIKFKDGLFSKELARILKEENGWKTAKVPKADVISRSITLRELLDAVSRNDSTLLQKVVDHENNPVLTKAEASQVMSKLQEIGVRHRLEQCEFEDLPQIVVSKKVTNSSGKTHNIVREFSKLSLGQQQSIMLTMLLHSDSRCPLLIDQPEDNLDGEFIYTTVVANLRRVKEHRQVIIVTHNPNIAVLGDADLIIPLKSTSEVSKVVERGAIDSDPTKLVACRILEGSERAFRRRREIYGY